MLNNKGFTLIELMIAAALGAIVTSGAYLTYNSQVRANILHDELTATQQGLRAALYVMSKELRKAGYDPDPNNAANAGILLADSDAIRISFVQNTDGIDNDSDGATDESDELRFVRYELLDADGDGDTDLVRSDDVANQVMLAANVDQLEFYYTMDDDSTTTTPGNVDDIRMIQVTLLGKTDRPIDKDSKATSYSPPRPSAETPPTWNYNDRFHRLELTNTVLIRNLM